MSNLHSIIPEDPKYDQVRHIVDGGNSRKPGRPPRPRQSQQDRQRSGRPEMQAGNRRNRNMGPDRRPSMDPARTGRQGETRRGRRPSGQPGPRRRKRKRGNNLLFWIIVAVFLIYAIPTTVSLSKSRNKLAEIQKEQKLLANEKEQLQDEVKELKNQLDTVDSDEFIRKYAHENLGMILPDEIVIKMKNGNLAVDKDAYKEASSIAEEAEKNAQSAEKEGDGEEKKSEETPKEGSSEAKSGENKSEEKSGH